MKEPFDIFWFGDSGPSWIETVGTLKTARDHIEKLPHKRSGGCGVLDQRTGNRISFVPKAAGQTDKRGGVPTSVAPDAAIPAHR
jgi:hypothetical protein